MLPPELQNFLMQFGLGGGLAALSMWMQMRGANEEKKFREGIINELREERKAYQATRAAEIALAQQREDRALRSWEENTRQTIEVAVLLRDVKSLFQQPAASTLFPRRHQP